MNTAVLPIIICGASGRMGKELIGLCLTTPGISLAGACVRSSNPLLGQDVGQSVHRPNLDIFFTNSLHEALKQAPQSSQKPVVIDFSARDAVFEHASSAEQLNLPLLVGVTGLEEDHLGHLAKVSAKIPVLVAPNTSIGGNLLALISAIAAKALPNADIEICETHHRHKKDSPSGTAYFLADHIAKERGIGLKETLCLNRHGAKARIPGEIGVFGLRGGEELGTHTVHLFDKFETLELTHRVNDRRVFAAGALTAARFLAAQTNGLYNMLDVFRIDRLLNEKI